LHKFLQMILVLLIASIFLSGCRAAPEPLPLTPTLEITPAERLPSFPATWTPSPTLFPTTQSTRIPTQIPTPISTLPATFQIHGIVPRSQKLPLDCEANVATLWAGFFGYKIGELQFQKSLPRSDNPNKGFSGDVNGVWGSTPPEGYGVHAAPVAITLNKFDVPALAVFQFSLENLKRQIAGGNPVMVWVVGHVNKGKAIPWKSSDGNYSYVAPFEHTVLVVGYDAAGVTILDNEEVYGRSYKEFMDSWGVLGFMAIIKYP
jgi:uncharacterized protein YvpB